jgi:hypothetical protein
MLCRYYCTGGAKSSTPNDSTGSECPAGYYCPEGSTEPTACPPGTFTDTRGLTGGSGSECTECLSGYFCPLRGATSNDLRLSSSDFKCYPGFICTGGAMIPNPMVEATDGGTICDEGYYCPEGSQSQEMCDDGYYNPYKGQGSCIICHPGKYCPYDPLDPNSGAQPITAFVDCPAGSYCEEEASEPVPCPAGTYSPFENLESEEECIDCPPGMLITKNSK